MKKFLLFVAVFMAFVFALTPLCFAEETGVAEGDDLGADSFSYAEKEQLIRDVIDTLLEKGDETFAGKEWWEVAATWVRSNLGAVVAGVAGVITLVGALWLSLRTNPTFRAYVNSLGTSCKTWFETIGKQIKETFDVLGKMAEDIKGMAATIKDLRKVNMLLVDTLEDVIKLSGADEGKKEIYIKKIEEAKKTCSEGGDGDAA